MATSWNPVTNVSPGAAPASGASDKTQPDGNAGPDQVATKETFLKLLVAQIKNQDPLNPADGLQFVTQLAQFSELEQLIAIRQDLEGQPANQETAEGVQSNASSQT